MNRIVKIINGQSDSGRSIRIFSGISLQNISLVFRHPLQLILDMSIGGSGVGAGRGVRQRLYPPGVQIFSLFVQFSANKIAK